MTVKKPKCSVHIEIKTNHSREDIRNLVCQNLTRTKHADGKHYCRLHKPEKDKNASGAFGRTIDARIKAVNTLADRIKRNESDENKQNEEIAKLRYDFRYVMFPPDYVFKDRIFNGVADFSSATFMGDAYFKSAKFQGRAEFRSATFRGTAVFENATFFAEAFFGWATFSSDVNFKKAKFKGPTETFFNFSNFARTTIFDNAEFDSDVSFDSAVFGEDSDVFFYRSSFKGNVDFQYCIAKGLLRFSELRDNDGCTFDFQEAAFENASRISFHTMTLRPNWFVNVDSRKFVFAEINWKNVPSPLKLINPTTWRHWRKKEKNKNIYNELIQLKARESRAQDKRLYEVVLRELKNRESEDRKRNTDPITKYELDDFERLNLKFNPKAETSEDKLDASEECDDEKTINHLYLIVVREILVSAVFRNLQYTYSYWPELSDELKDEYIREEQKKLKNRKTTEEKRQFIKSVVRKIADNVASRKKYAFVKIERQILTSYLRNKDFGVTPEKISEIKEELEEIDKFKKDEDRKHLLGIAVRQLAVNAEDNNLYDQASEFRYMAMETKALEYKWDGSWRLNKLNPLPDDFLRSELSKPKHWLDRHLRLSRWYRFSSSYGEKWLRALMIFLIMVFLFLPFIYYLVPFETCFKDRPIGFSLQNCPQLKPNNNPEADHNTEANANPNHAEGTNPNPDSSANRNTMPCTCHRDEVLPIFSWNSFLFISWDSLQPAFKSYWRMEWKEVWERLKESEYQSLAIATFHEPEYRRPINTTGEVFLVLEKFLSPIQLALLALAIRRKFMR